MKPPTGREKLPARGQPVLVEEKDAQIAAEAHESPEGNRIQRAEPVGVRLPQQRGELPMVGGTIHRLVVSGQHPIHCGDDEHDGNQDTEDAMPSERDGQERGQGNADDRATVPRSGHAHGETLVREGVRAAGEGQRDGKAGARDAEQEPDADHLRKALPGLPGPGQWNHSQQHADDPSPPGPVPV